MQNWTPYKIICMELLKRSEMRVYDKSVSIYSLPGSITVQRGCTSFMFTNIGDTIAWVEGMIIFPNLVPATGLGDSRTVSAHELDLYTGNINLRFDTVAPGVNPNVEIVQVYYIMAD